MRIQKCLALSLVLALGLCLSACSVASEYDMAEIGEDQDTAESPAAATEDGNARQSKAPTPEIAIVTYEVDFGDADAAALEESIGNALQVIRNRLEYMGLGSSEVYSRDNQHIVVEMPVKSCGEYTVNLLAKPGILEFRDAEDQVLLTGAAIESADFFSGTRKETASVCLM